MAPISAGYGYWNGNGNAYRRSLASHIDPRRFYEELLAMPFVDKEQGDVRLTLAG